PIIEMLLSIPLWTAIAFPSIFKYWRIPVGGVYPPYLLDLMDAFIARSAGVFSRQMVYDNLGKGAAKLKKPVLLGKKGYRFFCIMIPIGLEPTTSCLSRSEEHTSELQSRFDLVCR